MAESGNRKLLQKCLNIISNTIKEIETKI
jgi:hypothetical protein